MKTEKRGVVGYIPKGFPRLSETFVANEILELERLGLEVHLFPLIKPVEAGVQPSARAVGAPVRYVPERVLLALHQIIPAHVALAFKRPGTYARVLGRAVRRAVRRRSTASLRRFAQAGFLVERLLPGDAIHHFHAHFCHGPTTVALFVKWLTGASMSFTAHAKDLYTTAPESIREKMAAAEFVLTCTKANRSYLESIGGDVAQVYHIYHGIDLSRFASPANAESAVRDAETATQTPTILSVGRLVPKKGHDVLIRACGELRTRGVPFRCVIYGEGPIRGELEGLRASLGLEDCVELPGRILQDDLVERFAQADVFGLACKVMENGDRDGLPNVLIEALAMGVPVVSTHISGVPELVEDGVEGVLVPPGDPQAFADALARVLTDPAERRSMSRACRARVVEEFDTRRNTRRVLELFESLDGVGPVSRHEAEDVRPTSAPAPV